VRSLLTFRHRNPAARLMSTLLAFAIAMLLVVGVGPAYAEDAAPAPTVETVETPAAAPVDEAADEPAPVEEEPAPADESASGEPADDSADPAPAEVGSPRSETAATTNLAKSETPVQDALAAITSAAVACLPGSVPVVGNFEIDGDTCVETNLDWDSPGTVSVEDGFEDGSWFTGGSSKDNQDPSAWLTGGNVQIKTDIDTAYAWSHVNGGHVYSYFAFSRHPESLPGAGGDVDYDVEYNQLDNTGSGLSSRPDRSAGDLLLQVHQGGGTDLDLDGVFKYTLGTPGGQCFAVTGSSPSASWCPMTPGPSLTTKVNPEGSFAEGALDITTLFGEGNCSGTFGVVNIRSRASQSTTATLQDQIAPIHAVTPSTCGKIVINKHDQDGNPLGGATFSVSPNPVPGVPNATPYSITDNDAKDKDPADGVIEISPVDPNESYTVTETDAPDGYFLADPASQGPTLVGPSQTVTFTFVDALQWDALDATKTVEESYTAEYDWLISKEIATTPNGPWYGDTTAEEPLVKTVPAGGSDTLYYRVVVTEGERTTSDYTVTGTISVDNPNDEAVNADISDTLPGATCEVEGEAVHSADVPAGGADYDYVCTFAGNPTDEQLDGTNTAHVVWDKSDYPQTADDVDAAGTYEDTGTQAYAFGDETTSINKTVTITDNQHTFDPDPWEITWSDEGATHTQTYSRDLTVSGGACSDVFSNTATILGDDDANLGSDTAHGQVCEAADLTISDLDAETLIRTYPWTIDKATTTPDIRVVDGKAVADYDLTVTAGDGEDSAWNISGTITVENPNDFTSVDVTGLTVDYSGAADEVCSIDPDAPLTIASSDSQVFDYSCDFPTEPNLAGTITATVTWDGAAAGTANDEADNDVDITEADWEVTPVNDTVEVWDDNATPGDDTDDVLVDTLTWADVHALPGHTTVLDHDIEITEGLPELGDCNTHTNTATVLGDPAGEGDVPAVLDSDDADVEVCNPYALLQALKLDAETKEPLAGAEFTLFEQGDPDPVDTAVSGADGLAVFDAKLLEGSYTITETKAPTGYGLPINGGESVPVTITVGDLTNDEEGEPHAILAPVTFADPANGQLTVVSKEQFERDPLTNAWVPSDGVVDFGDQIHYVVHVKATGPKLFHHVTATDYVPGYNPVDTTTSPAGTKAVLDPASPACTGDFTCTSSADMVTGLVTWTLTGAGQPAGVVKGDAEGTFEMTVTMPDIPGTSPIKTPGTVFAAALWNQGYLGWDQVDFVEAPPEIALARTALAALVEPQMTHHTLATNEVVVTASATLPPVVVVAGPVASPGVLPNTGGPDAWLVAAGMLLLLGGGSLVVSDRRRRRRS
jgi:LPXTG-motif cell wall-anchored protein